MKILFDFQDMVGGAPRSHLAHMKLLKNAGYEVLATIGDDIEELKKLTDGIRIIPITNFKHAKGYRLIQIIRQWVRIIKKEKPDIIYSNRIPQFKFLAIVSDLSDTPLVFAQAGGVAHKQTLVTMRGKTPVAYSIENKKVFVSAGFTEDTIHVISNRIILSNEYLLMSKPHNKNWLTVLIVGNIKSVTINGYLHIIRLLHDKSSVIKKPCRIKIAGKDISAGKVYTKTVSANIAAANNAIKAFGKIETPTWFDNVQTIQAQSDVVIGKGRSVIEPAMQGKVCFVLAETGKLTRISPANFQSLYEYNFSGRGSQRDNTNEFLLLLSDGINDVLLNEAKEVSELIKQAYSLEYANEKLEHVFANALMQRNTSIAKRICCACKRFAWMFLFFIKNKLTK